MTDKPASACCGKGIYWEPLYYVGDGPKRRFGVARRCAACRKIVSDPSLDRPYSDKSLAALIAIFNGTSWSMMLDQAIKRPGSPLHFEKGNAGVMVPDGYTGELKAQPDLAKPETDLPDEEVPF